MRGMHRSGDFRLRRCLTGHLIDLVNLRVGHGGNHGDVGKKDGEWEGGGGGKRGWEWEGEIGSDVRLSGWVGL